MQNKLEKAYFVFFAVMKVEDAQYRDLLFWVGGSKAPKHPYVMVKRYLIPPFWSFFSLSSSVVAVTLLVPQPMLEHARRTTGRLIVKIMDFFCLYFSLFGLFLGLSRPRATVVPNG
jgi:hypothetical protein